MPGNQVTVYLKLNQISEVHSKRVTLGDVAEVYCSDTTVQQQCREIVVKSIKDDRNDHYMMGVLEVIRKIEDINSLIQVSNVGESDFIIKYQQKKPYRNLWQWAKTVFVCVACFCGAAFAIMTFNNDANVSQVFRVIYQIVMGSESSGFTIMEISYSIGLAVGIIVFFNHFISRKLSLDPTPLEVEMRLYEENVNKTLIQNYGRKESNIDVT